MMKNGVAWKIELGWAAFGSFFLIENPTVPKDKTLLTLKNLLCFLIYFKVFIYYTSLSADEGLYNSHIIINVR